MESTNQTAAESTNRTRVKKKIGPEFMTALIPEVWNMIEHTCQNGTECYGALHSALNCRTPLDDAAQQACSRPLSNSLRKISTYHWNILESNTTMVVSVTLG